MAAPRVPLSAILGPTNTGKTHLAVERMCAHSSGMMGFPLRLLAREIYERVVALKGAGQVALITGEERIEPAGARYYCCTVESMPLQKEFAFVALDEAQLGADPERGHIFTDRLRHARGREETMILGSESLRPLIRKLLPESEITTRPRFSTLSYAGPKKLSRLPKRSAIVAFSVEQVYVVAELLRRLRGGAAVVMGALSPRTRNAQVAMFQSGEVDYLVATDAIGMGLNLDVDHVAFASLTKFDGNRVRRLSVAEMAQIAGRAGRHQRDGSFGTLAGSCPDMTGEEVLAIENHHFPPLDWLYWREAEPRTDSIARLIADLGSKPDEAGLVAAPQAIDLAVLKRLSEMAEVTRVVRKPEQVARLWDVARLPDFRQMGEEHHARFIAGLWRHLGEPGGVIPQSHFAQELSRLDTIQGDVDTLAARIAAVRTWTYVAHRDDWLDNPPAMAARAREVEEKLSDALHDGLRQRFVDRRMSHLLKRQGPSTADLAVTLDEDNHVLVDGEDIGTLDGFAFRVDATARATDRKLLLATAERHLSKILKKKVERLTQADDSEFSLGPDKEGRPAIFWSEAELGKLVRGKALMAPAFKAARAVAGLEGEELRAVTDRAEAWIAAQLEKAMGGVVALQNASGDAALNGQVRALAAQLADAGGIAGRQYLAEAIASLPKEARGDARKAGIVFGALDIYHHAALKPAAAKWRSALFAARDDKPMAALPPESAVHLKEWNFASLADCRNAGFRRIGDEYVRIDLAERVIKKAHEARGPALVFAMDMAFATSLGLSEKGLRALMRDAGFRGAIEADVVKPEQVATDEPMPEAIPVAVEPETAVHDAIPAAVEPCDEAEISKQEDAIPTAETHAQPVALSYWRWVGLRKTKPNFDRNSPRPAERAKSKGNQKPRDGQKERPKKDFAKSPPPSPPSSLALQLAALKGLKT